MTDALEDRKRALEEEHFRKLNAALIDHMRQERREAEESARLQGATGVTDPVLLDELIQFGFTPETLPALAVGPLLEVAWTDGKVDSDERRVILSDDSVTGLDAAGPSMAMVHGWLEERPAGGIFRLWWEFTHAEMGGHTPDERAALAAEMLVRATAVARASGGFLGIGSPTSAEEHVALKRIKAAYEP